MAPHNKWVDQSRAIKQVESIIRPLRIETERKRPVYKLEIDFDTFRTHLHILQLTLCARY